MFLVTDFFFPRIPQLLPLGSGHEGRVPPALPPPIELLSSVITALSSLDWPAALLRLPLHPSLPTPLPLLPLLLLPLSSPPPPPPPTPPPLRPPGAVLPERVGKGPQSVARIWTQTRGERSHAGGRCRSQVQLTHRPGEQSPGSAVVRWEAPGRGGVSRGLFHSVLAPRSLLVSQRRVLKTNCE